jgi:hypothetical protein
MSDQPGRSGTKKSDSPLLGVEGLRCLRSLLSFDLEALDRLAAYFIYASLVAPWRLTSNSYMVGQGYTRIL